MDNPRCGVGWHGRGSKNKTLTEIVYGDLYSPFGVVQMFRERFIGMRYGGGNDESDDIDGRNDLWNMNTRTTGFLYQEALLEFWGWHMDKNPSQVLSVQDHRINPVSIEYEIIIYFHNHPLPFGAYPFASILATRGFTVSQNV